MSMSRMPARGLYAITDGPRADLLQAAEAALLGGAVLLQYRDLADDDARRRDEAAALATLCRDHGVPLVIDHDIALMEAVGADGVHLGRDDDDPAAVRRRLGARAIIGVSGYADPDRARAAATAGADYVSFGAFHASPTKPGASRADPGVLAASAGLGVARVAIGGITPDNGAPLLAAGADLLAAVTSVFGSADVRAAAARFASLFASQPVSHS